MTGAPMSGDLENRLREHPFHRMLHGGKCTKAQVQAWALNRYFYRAVVDTLAFKYDVLWCMLDALHYSYVAPGLIPPGAFVPKASDV